MIRFKVPDMTCSHCAGTITKAVKAQDAAARVEIDLAAHTVQVESTVPAEQIRKEIEEAGYSPELDG